MDDQNKDPKDDKKDYSAYVSPRLKTKMGRYDDEDEEKGPGAMIAVIGLAAVLVIAGGLFFLGSKNHEKETGHSAEAAGAPNTAMAAADSAAFADSLAGLARADSIARAMSQATAMKAAAATPAARAAAAPATDGEPAPAAPPTRYGIAIGSYLFDDKAASEKDRVAAAASLSGSVVEKTEGGASTYQVVVGSFTSRAEAEAKGAELLAAGTIKESRVVPLKR